jgi:hypothetical protein
MILQFGLALKRSINSLPGRGERGLSSLWDWMLEYSLNLYAVRSLHSLIQEYRFHTKKFTIRLSALSI